MFVYVWVFVYVLFTHNVLLNIFYFAIENGFFFLKYTAYVLYFVVWDVRTIVKMIRGLYKCLSVGFLFTPILFQIFTLILKEELVLFEYIT